MRVHGLAVAAVLIVACGRNAPTTSAAAPTGTLALGERVTSQLVPLSDIARDPAHYRGQVIATSGKVTSVCREMGCWLELEDAAGHAHVRIHGHTFFVPKTAPGHVARVQAKVESGGLSQDDCEEQAANGTSGLAKIELDATGVEID
ncbi:MAG TPA: DUF4920 domain-containing protein [Polyangiaceae bacterium]|nr:DUF4920 domain-containing protein [Polyangiaceae bacterium]